MEFDITTYISEHRPVELSFVRTVLTYPEDIRFIDTFDKYDMIFKIRHDYVHWIICQSLGYEFGEKPISSFPELSRLTEYRHWNLIKNQTPDIIVINGNKVKIVELTISNSRLAKKEKITKYSLLVDAIKKSGFTLDLEIIVLSSTMSQPAIQSLVEDHKIPPENANMIYTSVSKLSKLISQVESTPYGQEWNARRSNQKFADVDLGITDDMIINYHHESKYKCFESDVELQDLLNHDEFDNHLSEQDEDFLNFVTQEAFEMKTSFDKKHDLRQSIISLRNYHGKFSNTKTCRSFMPLPFLQGLIIDSSQRSTEHDESEFVKFKSRLLESQDSFFYKLSQMQEYRGKIHLDLVEKSNIGLQGPGRKFFIKQGSVPHIRKQQDKKNYWFDYTTPNYDNDLDALSFELSKISKINIDNPSDFDGVGLNYVKCCQSIFREITINAMRKDRRHDFIFKPTGIDGVYLLLYPGAKLRTGENLSTIWFKLFTTQEKIPVNKLSTHWAFKSWNNEGSFLHTNWISCDANRLDHYLRCYDRILMAYLSYMHSGQNHLEVNIKEDQSNTLGVILMIYMENKRSTSKMLQDVRYLVMGSLSKYRWWDDLIDKYKEPIRTPLQAYLLSKIEKYSLDVYENLTIYIHSFKFGKVYQESDIISDRLAGAVSELPRALTKGPKITFPQLLCEMYFTMLFNKNQDDPTHATFQILNKMLEGEQSLQEVKSSTGLHMGGNDPINDAKVLIMNPHKNQFSKYAIMIGSKLQSLSEQNKGPAGLAHKKAAQNKFLNKPLSEFATYKSSAIFERDHYSQDILTRKVQRPNRNVDSLEERFREGGEDNEDPVSIKFPRQNPRRRCIEGIIDLLNKDYLKSFDVIESDILNEMYFQVFKKNQIGGVREILILPIEKRITINILESFSRLICKFDEREMLTHGDIKITMMRDMIRDVRRSEDKRRIVLNHNLDKTRWGPSFMPIQFMYMFKPFANNYPSLFRFILLTLMVHSNKKCLIPEKLINVWVKDSQNKIIHNEPLLQKLKERFLSTGEIYFDNESNMGQGILHYTSSYLHLCALSFRDTIYRKLCEKIGISTGVWRDIVSSDDSYTAHSLPMDGPKNVNVRITLFLRAQEVTERLFNMWTSKSKSSISFLLSEFNSMFGSNLTLFPTLFKFALASVAPTNTDSFFRMVKESFNTCRQIVENGGSLELYMIAHKLNKTYCESIYHTHESGFNDFNHLNLTRSNVPYQLGVYPIMNPAVMLILGPECHNYSIMSRFHELNSKESNLFESCHNFIPVSNPEIYSELNSFDNIFTGMLRIEAATGPVRKLQRIKRQVDMSWEEMQKYIEDDITLLLREPKGKIETKIQVYQKLFSYGAAEALRDTAASIYYARVAATVSASAFHIPYHEEWKAKYDPKEKKMIGRTYHECLLHLIETKNEPQDLSKYYPHMREFNDLSQLTYIRPTYKPRNQFETQNIKHLQLTEITMRIKNPIKDLIDHFWINTEIDKPTSYYRDWVTLKELIPVIDDSLELTLDNFKGDRTMKIKTLILVLMRIMSYTNKPMKAVIYGPSTRTYDQTYLTLMQQNLYHSYTSTNLIINQSEASEPRLYDRLYYYHNLFVLSVYYNKVLNLSFEDLPLTQFIRDSTISFNTKKRIMMMLMYYGYLDDYETWTGLTHSIMHYWLKRQHRLESGEWRGDFRILLQCGSAKMIMGKTGSKCYIIVSTLDQPMVNLELLNHGLSLVTMDIESFIKCMNKGRHLILSDRIVPIIDPIGVDIKVDQIENIMIDTGDIYLTSYDKQQFMTLDDVNGYQIMKIQIGLLPTDYIPFDEEHEDVLINGISIYQLSKIRIFTNSFDFSDIDPDVIIDILPDLDVERPKISDITKDRLRGLISQDWETKGVEEYYEEADEKFEGDPMDLLKETTITLDEFKQLYDPGESDPFDQFLIPDFNWELISNLPVIRAKIHPQRILERVINCKYHFIARSCIDPGLLSKKVIKAVYKQTLNNNIIYSLVYLYDKMFTIREVPSPLSVNVSIRDKFLKKFKILDEDLELM